MVTMSMNKAIHGAVRRDLGRFEDALAAFPAGDTGRAGDLVTAWDQFEHQLTRHHEGEHAIAWPRLQEVGVPAALIGTFDSEHEVMAGALADAGSAVRALRRTPDAATAQGAHAAVGRLREVTELHLDHEEAEIEPVFMQHQDHPAMKAMGKEFAREGGLKEGGQFFAWVLDGAAPPEREAITSTVPGPVLTVLTRVFGRDYTRRIAPVWR